METDKEITRVVFRKFKVKGFKDVVIALFPDDLYNSDLYSNDIVMSYETVGQHGSASYSSVMIRTYPAKPIEYANLQSELESLGYNLKIVKRR